MGTHSFKHENLSFIVGFPGIDSHRIIESNDVGMLEGFDSLVILILKAYSWRMSGTMVPIDT